MMKKVLCDLSSLAGREQIHEYLKIKLDFPDYYGKNLDALYDCLTDISEDVCVGLYLPSADAETADYCRRIRRVFTDAEQENRHLTVFCFPRA